MEDPAELREQYVFSRKTEEDESTVMTTHSVLSIATATGSATGSDGSSALQEMPENYASALSAAGLTSGIRHSTPVPIDDEQVGLTSDTPQATPLGEIDDKHRGPEQILVEVHEENEPGAKTVAAVHIPQSHALPVAPVAVGAVTQTQLLHGLALGGEQGPPLPSVETEATSGSALLSFRLCCSEEGGKYQMSRNSVPPVAPPVATPIGANDELVKALLESNKRQEEQHKLLMQLIQRDAERAEDPRRPAPENFHAG